MRKNIKIKNTKTVRFSLDNFLCKTKKQKRKKHALYSKRCEGFLSSNNKLSGGYGVSNLSLNFGPLHGIEDYTATIENIDGSAVTNFVTFATVQGPIKMNCLFVSTATRTYMSPLYDHFFFIPLPNITKPFKEFATYHTANFEYIFACNEDGLYYADRSLNFVKIDTECIPLKLYVFAGRLFALHSDRKTIYFSSSFAMHDFSGNDCQSGFLSLDDGLGKVLGFDSFGDKLLVIRERGFTQINCSFDAEKFEVSNLATTYEQIIDGTTQVLDNSIYFLTSQGICEYSNNKLTLLDIDISDEDLSRVTSCSYNYKYYLALSSRVIVIEKFFDSYTIINNLSITKFGEVYIDCDSRLGVLIGNKPCIYQLDTSSKIDNENVAKVWETDEFALSYASNAQYLKQVIINTNSALEFTVITNRGEHTINLQKADDLQKINLNIKGDVFRIRLVSRERECVIKSLTAVIGFISGVEV